MRTICACGTPLILRMQSGLTSPSSTAHFTVSFPTRFAIVASRRNFFKVFLSIRFPSQKCFATSICSFPSRNFLPRRCSSQAPMTRSSPCWQTLTLIMWIHSLFCCFYIIIKLYYFILISKKQGKIKCFFKKYPNLFIG